MLKLDFEKAYDKVKWPFLQHVLRMKGFSPKWASWIQQVTSKGFVGIKVNDSVGRYSQTKKGVRQDNPLSPILFDIIVDVLTILIAQTKDNDLVRGLGPNLVDDGLSILQYADDTILFYGKQSRRGEEYEALAMCF
jgi:hypothetical protein